MVGMTLSKDRSSNEHKTNPMKKHIDKSQEVSSIIVELNRKGIGQMRKGFVLFIVIIWNARHMTSRFAAPSIIYAPIRLHIIFQISRIFIFVYFISDYANLKLNTRFAP